MWHFKLNTIFILLCFTFQIGTAKEKLKADSYFISSESKSYSNINKWFVEEMIIRGNSEIIKTGIEHPHTGRKLISLKIDPELVESYCIKHNKEELRMIVKSESDAKWLVFQFIESLSQEDNRFRAEDLPPATIQFKTHCYTFDFEYREPFLPSNLKEGGTEIFGTNSVDTDWGIWGHNLSKILDITSNMTALVNETRDQRQLCFSSSELFEQLSEFIINNFGYGTEKPYRFMIMPNDNDLVCHCTLCQKEGNTTSNASPAVTAFIKKLSEKFPEHWFFTSAYRTTKTPPDVSLPPHSGVFISTIDLPQGISFSRNKKRIENFKKEIAKWKKVTHQLYIWDYISNFDDYLTPVPILYSLKERLIFFKEMEFKGVFLNGSGYDYSSFEDMKTYVSANLMRNTQNNVDSLIKTYFQKEYGSKAAFITAYYLQLEKDFVIKNIPIEIYGGMSENTATYFDRTKFLNFYEKLQKVTNEEKYNQLKTALAFTRLQTAYFEPTSMDFQSEKGKKIFPDKNLKQILTQLEKHRTFLNMNVYREEKGELEKFISFWKEKILNSDLTNLILNESVINSNNFSQNTQILTDGLPGNENDYHQGWFISSSDMELEWKSNITGNKTMNLRFLLNEKHGFIKPEKIELKINDADIALHFKEKTPHHVYEFSSPLILEKGDQVKLIIKVKNGRKNKIALDEIKIL